MCVDDVVRLHGDGALERVQIFILLKILLSGRESSLVQTFCKSREQLDITLPSVHMTCRFVIQGCPTLRTTYLADTRELSKMALTLSGYLFAPVFIRVLSWDHFCSSYISVFRLPANFFITVLFLVQLLHNAVCGCMYMTVPGWQQVAAKTQQDCCYIYILGIRFIGPTGKAPMTTSTSRCPFIQELASGGLSIEAETHLVATSSSITAGLPTKTLVC